MSNCTNQCAASFTALVKGLLHEVSYKMKLATQQMLVCCVARREADTATVFMTAITDNCISQPEIGAK